MAEKEKIQKHLAFIQGSMKKIFDAVAEDDSMFQLYENANHPRWQVGHLVNTAYSALKILGEAIETPANYKELYGGGSEISGDASKYAAYGELKTELYGLWDKLHARLATIDQETLDRELDWGPDFKPTISEALLFLGAHDFYHAGQVVQNNRAKGKDRPFG